MTTIFEKALDEMKRNRFGAAGFDRCRMDITIQSSKIKLGDNLKVKTHWQAGNEVEGSHVDPSYSDEPPRGFEYTDEKTETDDLPYIYDESYYGIIGKGKKTVYFLLAYQIEKRGDDIEDLSVAGSVEVEIGEKKVIFSRGMRIDYPAEVNKLFSRRGALGILDDGHGDKIGLVGKVDFATKEEAKAWEASLYERFKIANSF